MTIPHLHLGFAGTPTLAATVLESLLSQATHRVEIVYTQPDRPAGRGRSISQSPVKQLALQHDLKVIQPENPADLDPHNYLPQLDLLVVVAYGMLLPAKILSRPGYGCINIHTSLLPRWRGAAPVQRAIQAGDSETGVTIMQMDEGLDTGPVLAQSRCSITPCETSGTLYDKLANLGAQCLLETLDKLSSGNIKPVPQNPQLVTYANKITKAEARLDWLKPAIELERQIRAFNPAPIAYTEINGERLRIWEAEVVDVSFSANPGTVISSDKSNIDISTAKKALRLLKIQPSGKRIMTVSEFLNGRPDFLSKTQ